jgi:hypothetical protein
MSDETKVETIEIDSSQKKQEETVKWDQYSNDFYLSTHKNQFPSLNLTQKKNEELLTDSQIPGFVKKSLEIFTQDWKVFQKNPTLYKPQPLKPEFTYQSLAPTEKEEEDELSFISETKSDDEDENSSNFSDQKERRGSAATSTSGTSTPTKTIKKSGWMGIKFNLQKLGATKSTNNLGQSFRMEDDKKKSTDKPTFMALSEDNKVSKILEVSKTIEKILPADSQYDDKKVEIQNNLLSLSRPNFKWTKTEEVFGDRIPSQPYPLGKFFFSFFLTF